MLDEDEDRRDFTLSTLGWLEAEAEKNSRLPVPHGIKRSRVVQAFNETFELIGGVPRMAIWANQNPSKFYQLYGRLVPPAVQEHAGQIKLIHSLERTVLDGEVEEVKDTDGSS